jgi:phosphoesterase RecJ-like protein
MSLAQRQAVTLIQSSKRIYLATHIRPDGDALGSMLALALALEAAGHRVAPLCADPVPKDYHSLPAAARVSATPPDWPADLGLVVDCDGLRRVGSLQDTFAALPHLIDIDHHATEQFFGDVQLIDSGAAATAEIVYGLLPPLGAPLTPEIATCLYAAIFTDTGRFCFSNTTAQSLAISAELVRAGANPAAVATQVYFQRSFEAVRLLGVALARLALHHEGRAISSVLYLQDFADTGAQHEDTEGVIDHIRSVGGPEVAAMFTEIEGGETRVSLRSGGRPDISRIAVQFGGGGHAPAAGCTLQATPEEARARVLAAVGEALQAEGGADGR